MNEYSHFLHLEQQRQRAEAHQRNARMLREVQASSSDALSCGEMLFGRMKRKRGMLSLRGIMRRFLYWLGFR